MKELLNKILDKALPRDSIFDKILKITLSFEGEYTKRDEPTYKGITERLYKAYADQHGWTIKELRSLTDEKIREIYYNEFYLRPKIFTLPQEIQGLVFDFAVNSGASTAVRELQKILGAKVDGHIGNETRDRSERYLRKFGVNSFIIHYHKRRKGVMWEAVLKNPKKKENWNGWMKRLNSLKEIYGQ